MNILDGCALSVIGTAWLLVPAYCEEIHEPFSLVSSLALVEMPLVVGLASSWCFVARGRVRSRLAGHGDPVTGGLLFFAFMAYFWSLIDDGPVNFDSVLTWPEVTSGVQHTFMEILLHALTLAFFYLAVRAALKGATLTNRGGGEISLLLLASFWASYAQNTPLGWVQGLVASDWYPLDAVEHLASVVLFCLAIRGCLTFRPVGGPAPANTGKGTPAAEPMSDKVARRRPGKEPNHEPGAIVHSIRSFR